MMSASFSNYVDLADAERIELDLNGKEALLEDAEASVHSGWPEPTPLVRPMEPPAPFPSHALGPVLENAARGIEEIVQCPLSLAACSVRAAASPAAQAHVDVIHPATGHAIPTSLFILTVAESGERKSAADKEALAGFGRMKRSPSRNSSWTSWHTGMPRRHMKLRAH